MTSTLQFSIQQCTDCRLRFPSPADSSENVACPSCGKSTRRVVPPFQNQIGQAEATHQHSQACQVEVLVDNLRSAWNVGAIFRTADGCGVQHLHLCGVTPTPDNPKTSKTALGAETMVPWTFHPNGLEAALELKSKGFCLWGLETSLHAQSIFEAVKTTRCQPIVLVIGNELSGIDPDILKECKQVIAIPMLGYKRSLNVAIAFGVAAYTLRFSLSS